MASNIADAVAVVAGRSLARSTIQWDHEWQSTFRAIFVRRTISKLACSITLAVADMNE